MSTYPDTYSQPQRRSAYPPVQPPSRPPSVLPPYSGAPPIPAGVAVNPRQWKAGFWQINPAYKHSGNSQSQQQQPQRSHNAPPWIISPQWINRQSEHHPQHSPESFTQASQQLSSSPNKRVYIPPSAEYLACELSSNPLGLENMVPVDPEEYNRRTSWIWSPRKLEGDNSQPESFTSRRELQPTFSVNIVRVPEHYRTGFTETLPQLSVNNSNGINPSSFSRHYSMSMPSSTSFESSYSSQKRVLRSDPMLTDQLLDEPDSMLSPLIIAKTPMLPAPSNLRTLRNHPNPLLATQSLDPIPEGASSYKGMRVTPSPPPCTTQQQRGDDHYPQQPSNLQHSYTMPTPRISVVVYPPSPPEVVLSPKTPAQERLHEILEGADRGREREREQIEPVIPLLDSPHPSPILSTLSPRSRVQSHEMESSSPQMDLPPRNPDQERLHEILENVDRVREREREHISPYIPPMDSPIGALLPRSLASVHSRPSSRASSRSSSSHASPIGPAIDITTTTYPTSPPSAHNTSPDVPSLSNASRPNDPLPIPPQLAITPPTPSAPPPTFQRRENKKLRRGFWNQRGDFLTADGYIVHAPDNKAYPADLSEYPREGIGYQDHNLKFTVYVPRPQLPQSLSRYGEPPECPYEAICYFSTHNLFSD